MEKLFLLLLKESFNSKEALDFTKIKKICEANEIKAIFDYTYIYGVNYLFLKSKEVLIKK